MDQKGEFASNGLISRTPKSSFKPPAKLEEGCEQMHDLAFMPVQLREVEPLLLTKRFEEVEQCVDLSIDVFL